MQNILNQLSLIASDLNMKKFIEQMNVLLEELKMAINRSLECAFTAELERLDKLRDDLIKVLDKYLDFAVSASMLDQLRADQAKVVLDMRNRQDKRIAYMAYQDETGAISSMISGFETIGGAVEESKADVIVTALSDINKKFESLYAKKGSSVLTDPKVRPLRPIREDLAHVYSQITGYINAVGPHNPVLYSSVTEPINFVISDAKANLDATDTREETAKEKAIAKVAGLAI